jgi:hypothetical protein
VKTILYGFLLFVPGLSFGSVEEQCRTAKILTQIRPGAEWVMQADSMDKLKWIDKNQKKPSKSEVEKARKACIAEETEREQRKKQARVDVKNAAVPADRKVEALILLLDMDR